MTFTAVLNALPDTTIIPFKNNIVLAKHYGGFYFFRTDQNLRGGPPYLKQVVTEVHRASLPSDSFVQKILQRFYPGGYLYDYVRQKTFYTILSSTVYYNFFTVTPPTFLYYAINVEHVTVDEIWNIIVNQKLTPLMTEVYTLEGESVHPMLKQELVRSFNDEKTSNIDSAKQSLSSLVDAIKDSKETPSKTEPMDTKKENLKKELLNCDNVRADLERYKETLLTQPNLGHWDLFEVKEEDRMGFYARNPKDDINERVIGIDFGTKSTVVYYMDANNGVFPLPVGASKEDYKSDKRYENPTVLHFVSLENFLKAYNSKPGRPDTKWADLKTSHEAKRKYDGADSKDYCSFLSQLKQWTGGRKKFRIKAEKDNEATELKPFLTLKNDDINPIEYYAYYIGLYINNMRNTGSIYFDYYLSFPVTCEEKVKEKIRESFERGLRKSLPSSLLANNDEMANFKVRCYVSEPMAYAVCALQEFGCCIDETPTNYAIFDFGGGTTDFDFGTWEKLESRKYDYQIQSFGGEGIATCGGENILEDLAFEVFKENLSNMSDGDKYYPFWFGPTSSGFRGSEKFCVDSQESDANMHTLVEALRPFWEKSTEYLESDVLPDKEKDNVSWSKSENEDGKIKTTVNLFNNNGGTPQGVEISISRDFIRNFIQDKIKDAIDNFFAALNKWDNNGSYAGGRINIFLAGNSSKSPYVMDEDNGIFKNKIEEYQGGHELKLFPPLGTKEAIDMIKASDPDCQDVAERPDCKSGVAFGLISCHKGGKIKIAKTEDTPSEQFAYYIGTESVRKFKLLDLGTPNHKPAFNQWYELFEADENEFFLYYTDNANCIDGNMPLTKAKLKKCNFPENEVDENKLIWLRAVDPHTIEYAVADCAENIDKKTPTHKVELG